MKAKILLINLTITALLSSCSYFSEFLKEPDPTLGLSAASLYGQGKEFLDAEDYPNAIKYFDILEARYPFGVYSTQAMLDIAYASYQSDLRDESIINSDRFIRLYPNHPNVSYAYYLRALSNFDKDSNYFTKLLGQAPSKYDVTKLKKSFDDFTIVANKFPKSKYAKDSINRLIYLKNMMAKNELYIAKYYSKRYAHVAVVERIKYMIKNYSGTPSTKEALLLLTDSYNKLKMYDLAYDTARVFQKNFPGYKLTYLEKNVILTQDIEEVKETRKIPPEENSKSWYEYLNIFNYF